MLDLARTLTRIIPLETIILLLLCIFSITFGLRWIYRYYRSRFPGPLTFLCLQVGNNESTVVVEWAKLIHPWEFCALQTVPLDHIQPQLTLTTYCWGLCMIKLGGVKILANCKYLDLTAEVSPKLLVSYFTATIIKRLVEKDYFIVILIKTMTRMRFRHAYRSKHFECRPQGRKRWLLCQHLCTHQ
jgi:hypothetical protein